MLLLHHVDRLGPLRGWIYHGLSPLHLQGQVQQLRSHDVKQLVRWRLSTQRIPLCHACSHIYSLQPLRQLVHFTDKELYSEWLGGLSEVTRGWGSTPGFDLRLPTPPYCLWCLLPAEEMPNKRVGMSGIGGEGALNKCLLVDIFI